MAEVIETEIEETPAATTTPVRLTISAEAAAYVVLTLLIWALRLVALGDAPMGYNEAGQALAAWRVVSPDAPGADLTADSPLMFALQGSAFSLLGASEFSARLFGALVGVALTLSPLLFRGLLGSLRTFCLCLLLACSPVLLATARESSGVLLSALFTTLTLWCVWRYWVTARAVFAQAGIVTAAALLFLSEPAGFVLALTLLIAVIAAAWWSVNDVELSTGERPPIRERLAAVPWLTGLALALAVVLLVATGFMLYPQGLSMVGQVVGKGLTGLTVSLADAPRPFALLVSWFYEPVFWLLGGLGVLVVMRHGEWSFIERFLVLWVTVAIVVSLLYAGSSAHHALWLTLPFAALGVYGLVALFTDDRTTLIWVNTELANEEQRLRSIRLARLVTAVFMIALLLMFGMHLRVVSASFLTVATGTEGGAFGVLSALFERLAAGQIQHVRISIVWLLITTLFMIIGFFLAASLWGNQTALQGGMLGVLSFGLVVGVGAGWRAAVSGVSDAAEFWHRRATSMDVFLLRHTLVDLADRQTGGFTEIAIVAWAEQDSVLAWALRDFENTRFISADEVGSVTGEGIVILPAFEGIPPLGSGYLGQNFLIETTWSPSALQGLDAFAWWSQRRVREGAAVNSVAVLWLREDVFQGQ